jgi:hypothetical protein
VNLKEKLLIGCTAIFLVLIYVNPACIYAQDSKWQIRISGNLLRNTITWTEWYEIEEPDEFACNGVEGTSPGIQLAVEYAVSKRIGIEGSLSCIPTRLHAEVHWTSKNQFAVPKENLNFFPSWIGINFSLLQSRSWHIYSGLLAGIGIFGERDVRPEFGRARHFKGKNDLLYGGQLGIRYIPDSSHWRGLLTLQYIRTNFEAAELETGAYKQNLKMYPVILGLGVEYLF